MAAIVKIVNSFMVKKVRRYLTVGTVPISPQAIRAVNQVLRAKRLSWGPFTQKLETQFAKKHQVSHAQFVSSGMTSLLLALLTLKQIHNWPDGSEIIVPALTFPPTINAVLLTGLTPVFVDIEPAYYTIDPTLLERALTQKTRAVIAVHIAGLPAAVDQLAKFAKDHKLSLIEDAAQAMFTAIAGKPVGSFGDIACFSTSSGHVLSTGIGGFFCTNNDELARQAKSLANYGRDISYQAIDQTRSQTGAPLRASITSRFRFTNVGFNGKATELEAAIALTQMKSWQVALKLRQHNARRLSQGLASLGLPLQLPKSRPNAEHAFMLYPIVLSDAAIDRDRLCFFLESQGIETRPFFPIVDQPIYQRYFKTPEKTYPISTATSRQGFYIGCHQELSDKDIDYMVETFGKHFGKKT